MKYKNLFILSIISLFLIISCEEKDFTLGGENYYPHSDGSYWIYQDQYYNGEGESGQDVGEYIMLLFEGWTEESHPYYGYLQMLNVYDYSDEQQGDLLGTMYMLVDYSGTYQIYDMKYRDRFIYLRFPLSIGKVWEWNISDGGIVYTLAGKVIGLEDVSTPMGDFLDCVRVDYDIKGPGSLKIWYSDGVGMVRLYEEGLNDFILVDYNITPS